MILNTAKLKTMLNTLGKCKPNNLLEITNYYNMCFREGGLILTAYDGSNYIQVKDFNATLDMHNNTEENIIIRSDQFGKLVSKVRNDTVDLQVKEGYLQVKADGLYKCEIYEGEEYPLFTKLDNKDVIEVDLGQLKHGFKAGKDTKSNIASDGPLFNFLIRDEKLIGTNGVKLSCTSIPNFTGDVLITPTLAQLIQAMEGSDVTVIIGNEHIQFETDNTIVYGPLGEGVAQFPNVNPLLDYEFIYHCKLNVSRLLDAVDRLKLFLGKYEGHVIDMDFIQDALILSTNTASEVIDYHSTDYGDSAWDDVRRNVNVYYLAEILKAMKGELCTIGYNSDGGFIQLTCGTDTFILALISERRN